MKENFNLCRRVALGGLLQGYFHNLRGTLQGIFLELQLIFIKKNLNLDKEVHERINKALNLLQKLQNQIDTAFEEIYNEKTGPWDLKEIIEKEILFWEAFMPFKHKVKKEIIEEEKVLVEIPYNLLRGIFCNVCQEVFLNLKENTNLKIVIKRDKKVEFLWDKDINSLIYENLESLANQLRSLISIKVERNSISFRF
ncbi:MAG: hypothetical protein C0190_00435 [Thermodesulfobacterium geofontis]|uniref:Histidine kinase n=1 Tax=Thermodesulfobacterium geofontis TaxID=1295609 RepID=A0A2N7PQN7_9BACT|nr:MAG: hypothetical protein C0190_00435 [Thermodesulfobacterium geofontis]PMP97522.1 MAG: hypothetical protein C0169_02805 [Thermodesulfobacterium geofontis]